MAAITLQNIRDLLANMNGEDSTPSSVSRDRFINDTGLDIYSRSDWAFRRLQVNASFSISNSDGSFGYACPADFQDDSFYDLRLSVSGTYNDHVYTLVDEKNRDSYTKGDYACWLTLDDSVDGFQLNTWESETGQVLTYWSAWTDMVAGTDSTKIPFPRVLALGAYALLRVYNDPDYDNTREINLYERAISNMKGYYNRSRSARLIGTTEKYGSFIGRVIR
jgi:hypothetical protein